MEGFVPGRDSTRVASATLLVSLAAIAALKTKHFHFFYMFSCYVFFRFPGPHDPNGLNKRYLRQSRLCRGIPAREAAASEMACPETKTSNIGPRSHQKPSKAFKKKIIKEIRCSFTFIIVYLTLYHIYVHIESYICIYISVCASR